jgi:hypothetical protein
MENPSLLKGIDNKLVLSSASNVAYGSGIKTFQVNPNPSNDVHTQFTTVQSTGAKYVTDTTAAVYSIGNLPYITGAVSAVWNAVASTAGITNTISIIGINQDNAEVSENIVLNGTSTVATVNRYKCVNDIKMVSGGAFAAGVYAYVVPTTGTPLQDLRVIIYNNQKYNPFFMVGSKNGVSRKARLRSINTIYNTTATTNIGLHVCENNTVQAAATTKGVFNSKLRLIEIPVAATNGITFPDDGIVELNMGEMACWYREGTSSIATYIGSTWSLHNV